MKGERVRRIVFGSGFLALVFSGACGLTETSPGSRGPLEGIFVEGFEPPDGLYEVSDEVAERMGAMLSDGSCPKTEVPAPEETGRVFLLNADQETENISWTDIDGCEAIYWSVPRDGNSRLSRHRPDGAELWSSTENPTPTTVLPNGVLVSDTVVYRPDGTSDRQSSEELQAFRLKVWERVGDSLAPPYLISVGAVLGPISQRSFPSELILRPDGRTFLDFDVTGTSASAAVIDGPLWYRTDPFPGDAGPGFNREPPSERHEDHLGDIDYFGGAMLLAATFRGPCSLTWLARGYENAFTVDVPGCSELVGLHRWTTSTGRKLALLLVVDLGEEETPSQIPGKLRLVAVDVDTAQVVLDELAPGETPVERYRALPTSAQFPGGDLLWTWADSGIRKVYLERFRPELRFPGLARL